MTCPVEWTLRIYAALGWSVLVLSIAAVLLLYRLLRRGDASRVASLLYLVPPVTALMAWAIFGELLAPLAMGGMALTAVGRGPRRGGSRCARRERAGTALTDDRPARARVRRGRS